MKCPMALVGVLPGGIERFLGRMHPLHGLLQFTNFRLLRLSLVLASSSAMAQRVAWSGMEGGILRAAGLAAYLEQRVPGGWMLPPGWMWPHLAAALLAKFLERFFLGGLVGMGHSHRVDC